MRAEAGNLVPRQVPGALTMQLGRGDIFSKMLERGECLAVTVTSGQAWITLEGDAEDHVLGPQEMRVFHGPWLLVMEGLEMGAGVEVSGAICGDR